MNWTWEHIVWASVLVVSILWYLFVFKVFRAEKKKKNKDSALGLQKLPTFVNNEQHATEDLESLLTQIDEDQGKPELGKVFDKSDKARKNKSLIRKANEKFKIIRNRDDDPEQEMEKSS